jgi:hypothetical protein
LTFGFFLWAAITLFLLWFWGWTSYILFQQKRAWKAYAKKNNLRYKSNGLSDSPEVSGSLDGYAVKMFASDHGNGDARSRKMMTTIEVSLKSVLPSPCAVASGGMVKIVQQLDLHQEYRPDIAGWDTSFIARAREEEILTAYLTPMRVEALSRLMKRKLAWTILIFGGEIGLLRLDTSDALEREGKIGPILHEMIAVARVLELEAGEDKVIASKRRKDDGKQKVLRVDKSLLEEGSGLSLEED